MSEIDRSEPHSGSQSVSDEVAPFLRAVSEASDFHRDLLGFVPRGLFEEFARSNDLFVLALRKGSCLTYAGHLLFARRYPRARITSVQPVPGAALHQWAQRIQATEARVTDVFLRVESAARQGRAGGWARVRRSYLKEVTELEASDLAQSLLNAETITEIGRARMKTVTVFDTLFTLPTPVSLDRLQQLGCGRPHDLITTRAISDTQVQAILAEAFTA